MFFKDDRDALAYRDVYLTHSDLGDDIDFETCQICGDDIGQGELCYLIKDSYICRYCFEAAQEVLI